MLRYLRPELRIDNDEADDAMREKTDEQLRNSVTTHLNAFLGGPARHLLRIPLDVETLRSIYLEAAQLSYQLWTQRTVVRCTTFRDRGFKFDHRDPSIKAHALVLDEYQDDLLGKDASILVQPLLELYQLDEDTGESASKVLAPAEVWLDSSAQADLST